MFGNKNLVKSGRNNRSYNPWTTDLAPRDTNFRSALSPFTSLRDDIMDIFDNFSLGLSTFNETDFVPKIEVKDKGDQYVVSAEIPGMSDKDLNVTVSGNNLILEGEKKEENREEDKKGGVIRSEISYGSFYRAIPLNDDVNPDKITASYKDGVLKVNVDKRPEAQRTAKKIPISAESKTELKH